MRPWHLPAAIALLVALGSFAARAEWAAPKAPDVAMLAAAETLIVLDVLQTLDLKRHPELVFGELNLLMGAAGAFFTAGLWYAVPPEGRWVVPSVVMVLETFVIVGNARAG